MTARPNVVLVHGAWADGSCWRGVIEGLQSEGYRVTAPQFPLTALTDDVARLRQVLARQTGPTIVVGHSYGGHIISALGTDAPGVVGLVYVRSCPREEVDRRAPLPPQAPPPRAGETRPVPPGGLVGLGGAPSP